MLLDLESHSIPEQVLSGRRDISRSESRIAVASSFVLVSIGFLVFAANPVPSEDASILFRYSENVASGHGIVYNPGGPTVDGATDMLFMLALAGLKALSIRVELAAALVNAASLGAIVFLLYLSWRHWAGVAVGWALVPVAIILVGPVWQHGQLGYGTPTFAAACTVVAVLSEVSSRHPSRRNLLVLGLFVGLAGLVRPEGFILAPLVIAAQAFRTRSWRLLLVPSVIWLPIVATFVGWRSLYFGYPFPNPFYKKGGGKLHLAALATMAMFVVQAGLPLAAALATGLAVPASRRRSVSLTAVLAGWAAAWLLMSDEMNVSYRFQYSVLPVLLVLCAPLYREMRQGLMRTSMMLARVSLAFLLTATTVGVGYSAQEFLRPAVKSFILQVSNPERARQESSVVQVTEVLSDNRTGARRTVATTEAGYVAWRSGWRVTDLWGLNDKAIAHHGYMDLAQLAELSPEVIFAHVPTGNRKVSSVATASSFLPGWTDMSEPLLCFAHRQRYVLLGQWGDGDSLVVLGRPDIPDLEALQAQFATVELSGTRNSASDGVLPTPAGCA